MSQIVSKASTKEYINNYDRIFAKERNDKQVEQLETALRQQSVNTENAENQEKAAIRPENAPTTTPQWEATIRGLTGN